MRTIITVDEWDILFSDLLPYLADTNLHMVSCCMVDDINGIMEEALRVGNGGTNIEPMNFSSLVNYCISEATQTPSGDSFETMCAAAVTIFEHIFDELTNVDGWANYRHKLERYRVNGNNDVLTLYLDSIKLYDYSDKVGELTHRLAKIALVEYKAALCSR